jgi:hypothetical protein
MGLIKPGAMGNSSDPGKPGDFANSMAEAMEDAFNELLGNDGMKTFTVTNNSKESRDRRRLFVAIALGMVRHLKSNADGLQILNSLNTPTGEKIVVNTDPNPL